MTTINFDYDTNHQSKSFEIIKAKLYIYECVYIVFLFLGRNINIL